MEITQPDAALAIAIHSDSLAEIYAKSLQVASLGLEIPISSIIPDTLKPEDEPLELSMLSRWIRSEHAASAHNWATFDRILFGLHVRQVVRTRRETAAISIYGSRSTQDPVAYTPLSENHYDESDLLRTIQGRASDYAAALDMETYEEGLHDFTEAVADRLSHLVVLAAALGLVRLTLRDPKLASLLAPQKCLKVSFGFLDGDLLDFGLLENSTFTLSAEAKHRINSYKLKRRRAELTGASLQLQ